MRIKDIILKLYSKINTCISLMNIRHGNDVVCNFRCQFTKNTIIGNNCNFNGIRVTGEGKVVIGNNFHSGKNIRILTTNHNWKGDALPYDNTCCSKDVIIEDNVWLGESVMILPGVTIGEGAIIQAGSVCCKDVPKLAIAGGHPAVAFSYRDKAHYLELKTAGKFW